MATITGDGQFSGVTNAVNAGTGQSRCDNTNSGGYCFTPIQVIVNNGTQYLMTEWTGNYPDVPSLGGADLRIFAFPQGTDGWVGGYTSILVRSPSSLGDNRLVEINGSLFLNIEGVGDSYFHLTEWDGDGPGVGINLTGDRLVGISHELSTSGDNSYPYWTGLNISGPVGRMLAGRHRRT